MPVPPSGGSTGTWPRTGHRTRRRDLVDVEAVAGGEPQPDRRARQRSSREPRRVAGPRAAHPRLEHPADAVALEQQGEPGDVILVRMADRMTASIRRSHGGIRRSRATSRRSRIRSAVDEQPAAARSLDEDRIALADIEDGDPRDAASVGPRRRAPATASADERAASDGSRVASRCGRASTAGVAAPVGRA